MRVKIVTPVCTASYLSVCQKSSSTVYSESTRGNVDWEWQSRAKPVCFKLALEMEGLLLTRLRTIPHNREFIFVGCAVLRGI